MLLPTTTFSELRRIADVLDKMLAVAKPPPQRWPDNPTGNGWPPKQGFKLKVAQDTPLKYPPIRNKFFDRSTDRPKPELCKFCGEQICTKTGPT